MGHLEEFSKWPADRFIETGFGEGRTLRAAAQVYRECISIELHEGRYLNAIEQFKDQRHVRIYRGNSPEILRRVIDPDLRTVFWLDAHYVVGDVPIITEYGLNPILEELEIIKSQLWLQRPVILIDDWSTFRTQHQHWPELKKIEELMGRPFQRFPELPGSDVFGYA